MRVGKGDAWPLVRSHARGRRGVILPVVLLYLMAMSGVALTALVLTGSETRLTDDDVRFLSGWLEAEAAPGPGRELHGGFVLHRAPPGGGPSHHSVAFRPDPPREAGRVQRGAEVGTRLPGDALGIEAEGGACGAATPMVVVVDAGPGAALPDPPLPPHPRLGPIGVEGLATRATRAVGGDAGFEDGTVSIHRAAPATRIAEGSGSGLLIAEGDLDLAGDVEFRGLVLVGGDLTVRDDALVVGGVFVGGGLLFEGGGRVHLCPAGVESALVDLAPRLTFPVPAGDRLGRF